MKFAAWVAIAAAAALAGAAGAYPGGTPSFQTDVAPFCAGCHSSTSLEMLAGNHDRAQKEFAERKHISQILSAQKGYASLSETDRKTLVEQIRALDAASTVRIAAPAQVRVGEAFPVTVSVTGGSGPVVGIALVDRAHRWYARPAASAGWLSSAPPQVTGPDGQPQTAWLDKRPADDGREISFVNVTGIESDAATKRWASASVVFTLRAPSEPGTVPLAAAYFYGTEKATVLGYTTNALGWKEPRGGLGGASGRVQFSDVLQIQVVPGAPPTPEGAELPAE